ncbi:hypothetical protein [Bradyrhizobium sp.]|uniref:hypothetical protein n=1 Tax=Bradyrhizobium sp. TaxID=376 RepID=UPI0023945E72|nr:hypothetical protein [Bradyrhizobium sp.]MDE1936664.1 hypothetical protein [Bradyrhizobium sp.]
MDNYIARANIDHYLDLLGDDDIPPGKRSMVTKLLIEEEDKLSRDLEQLEFAEGKAAICRNRVTRQRRLRDGFVEGSVSRTQADRLLVNFELVLTHVEGFCGHLRRRLQASRL